MLRQWRHWYALSPQWLQMPCLSVTVREQRGHCSFSPPAPCGSWKVAYSTRKLAATIGIVNSKRTSACAGARWSVLTRFHTSHLFLSSPTSVTVRLLQYRLIDATETPRRMSETRSTPAETVCGAENL